jgi:hypothetical protein
MILKKLVSINHIPKANSDNNMDNLQKLILLRRTSYIRRDLLGSNHQLPWHLPFFLSFVLPVNPRNLKNILLYECNPV